MTYHRQGSWHASVGEGTWHSSSSHLKNPQWVHGVRVLVFWGLVTRTEKRPQLDWTGLEKTRPSVAVALGWDWLRSWSHSILTKKKTGFNWLQPVFRVWSYYPVNSLQNDFLDDAKQLRIDWDLGKILILTILTISHSILNLFSRSNGHNSPNWMPQWPADRLQPICR